MANLNDVIGWAPLTETLRSVAGGVPNPFPKQFFTVKPINKILGDRAKFVIITGDRTLAKVVQYGAPGLNRALRPIGDAGIRCLHSHETFTIDLVQLQNLRAFESYTSDKGVDWVRYQMDEAARRQGNTRVIGTSSVLQNGKIWISSAGEILPSASGAVMTVDFNVAATHQNQINGIISASWVNNATDILQQLANLQVYSKQQSGLKIGTALVGLNVARYLRTNDTVLDYLARDDKARTDLLYNGVIPSNLGGIKNWILVDTSFFESYAGVITEMWNPDSIVFLPELPPELGTDIPKENNDKMDWWAMYEGSYPIPNRLDIIRTPTDPMANHTIEYGQVSYATPNMDIPTFNVHSVDTFLTGLKNPLAWFCAIVAF